VYFEMNLVSYGRQIPCVFLRVAGGVFHPEAEGAQPPMRGCQGQHACGLNGILFEYFHHLREACFCIPRRNYDGCLMLVHPPRNRLLHGKIDRNNEPRAFQRLEESARFVRAPRIARDLVAATPAVTPYLFDL
jgi:hypothetical protein